MTAFLTLVYFVGAFTALYCFLQTTLPYRPITEFPEIWHGHTAVHQLINGYPVRPAYMVWQDRRLFFYDLWTNRTIGDLYDYTHAYTYRWAYSRVYLTGPIYGRRSLHEYFLNPHFRYEEPTHPVIKAIFQRRKEFWWAYCVRIHRDLLDRVYREPDRPVYNYSVLH